MDYALDLKQKGNEFTHNKKYKDAIAYYEKCVHYLNNKGKSKDEPQQHENSQKMLVQLWCNIAYCCLSCQQYSEAEEAASKALEIDGNSLKGLYRRALAREGLNLLNAAINDLTECIKLDTTNQEAIKLFKKLYQKISFENNKQLRNQSLETLIQKVENIVSKLMSCGPNDDIEHSVKKLGDILVGFQQSILQESTKLTLVLNSKLLLLLNKLLHYFLSQEGNLSNNEEKTLSPVDASTDKKKAKLKPNNIFHILEIHLKIYEFFHVALSKSKLQQHLALRSENMSLSSAQYTQRHSSQVFHGCSEASFVSLQAPLEVSEESLLARTDMRKIMTTDYFLQRFQCFIKAGVGVSTKTLSNNVNRVNLESEITIATTNVNKGVSVESIKATRSECCILIIKCIENLADLDDQNMLRIIELALNCDENPRIVEQAMQSLGSQADSRRRLGSKIQILKKSQVLMRCIEMLIQYLSYDTLKTLQSRAEFVLTTLFILLSDKDCPSNDAVQANECISSFLESCFMSNIKQDASMFYVGLKALLLIYIADRNAFDRAIANYQLLPLILKFIFEQSTTADDFMLHEVSTDVLISCMEFSDLRQAFLFPNESDGLCDEKAIDKMYSMCIVKGNCNQRQAMAGIKMSLCLARLSVHDEQTQQKIFQEIDFMRSVISYYDCLDLNEKQDSLSLALSAVVPKEDPNICRELLIYSTTRFKQQYLELLLFLSFHGTFKENLLRCLSREKKTLVSKTNQDTITKSSGVVLDDKKATEQFFENMLMQESVKQNHTQQKKDCILVSSSLPKQTQQTAHRILVSLYRIGMEITKTYDTINAFYFASILCNFASSCKDKELIHQNQMPGAPQLDTEQLDALQNFFKQLPEHSKPANNAKYNKGSQELANKFIKLIVDLRLIEPLLKLCMMKQTTLNTLSFCVEALLLIIRQPEYRKYVAKYGGISAFLSVSQQFSHVIEKTRSGTISNLYDNDLARSRQGLAQLAITLNPSLFSYSQSMEMISQLIHLLKNSYELYQYEAALALTNLTSFSEDNRERFFQGKGVELLLDMTTSDNDLCRAAGLECFCNMALNGSFLNEIAEGMHKTILQLLLAFLGETNNERAQIAASGCLAMLVNDYRVLSQVLSVQNAENCIKVVTNPNFVTNHEIQLRILTIFSIVIEYCEQHPSDVSEIVGGFKEKILTVINCLEKVQFKHTAVVCIFEKIKNFGCKTKNPSKTCN